MISLTLPTGVFSAIVRTLEKVFRTRRERARAVWGIASTKMIEIRETQALFVELLQNISDAADTAVAHVRKTKDTAAAERMLMAALKEVEKRRYQRHDVRRQNLAEARAYSERKLENLGIFKTLDDDVAEYLRQLMTTYAAYFYVGEDYSHDLGKAIFDIRKSRLILENQDKRFAVNAKDFERRAKNVKRVTATAIRNCRSKWAAVVDANALLERCMYDHNYIHLAKSASATAHKSNAASDDPQARP